jgi:hypothetical protein
MKNLKEKNPKVQRPSETKTAVVDPPIDPALLRDVAGFVDDPGLWFHTPNPEFELRTPIELLGTPDEARLRNRIQAAKLGLFS